MKGFLEWLSASEGEIVSPEIKKCMCRRLHFVCWEENGVVTLVYPEQQCMGGVWE